MGQAISLANIISIKALLLALIQQHLTVNLHTVHTNRGIYRVFRTYGFAEHIIEPSLLPERWSQVYPTMYIIW